MAVEWKQRPEAGNPALTRWFARACLRIGPGFARVLLWPVCAYFFGVRSKERRAVRAFQARVLDAPARTRDVWRTFWTFSQVVLDRVFLLAGRTRGMSLVPQQPEHLARALDRGVGCILLGSHLGSFEASRAIKRDRPEVTLRLVMDRSQSPSATAFLDALNADLAREVLDIGHAGGGGLSLLNALNEGALLAMLADRAGEGERTIAVPFMGGEALFPTGPHEVAMVTQAPIVLFWGLHEGRGRYRIVFEPFPTPEKVERRQREAVIRDSVRRYAARLEARARAAPYNWFNFYDFWADPS